MIHIFFFINMLLPSGIVTRLFSLRTVECCISCSYAFCVIFNHPESLLLLLEPGRSTVMAVQPSSSSGIKDWVLFKT